MKVILYFFLAVVFTLTLSSAIAIDVTNPPINIKLVGTLKDAKGNELGKVYIENFIYIDFFKADIFKKLVIKNVKNGVVKILYSINNTVFSNPKGIDITSSNRNFNGYKIEFIKGDSIQLFEIGDKQTGAGASDPALIRWNYKKKILKLIKITND